MSWRRSLAVGLSLVALLTLPGATSAATPISMQVLVGSSCIYGAAAPDKAITATLRTPGGKLRAQFRTRSDFDGFWFGCFLSLSGVNGGDRLKIEAGSQSRSVIVPKLVPSIDRIADTISGRAQPHADVQVAVTHAKTLKESRDFFYLTTADQNGDFSIDTTSDFNLLGGDEVTAAVLQGDDLFGALATVPMMMVNHAANAVRGYVNNSTRLELHLTDANGNPKVDVQTGPMGLGQFWIELYDEDGDAVYPIGRDWLSSNLANDATLRIPVSNLTASAANDTVDGRCMPHAPYALSVRFRTFYGTTDGNGNVHRDLSSRMNVRKGDDVQFLCRYDSGDLWIRTAVAL